MTGSGHWQDPPTSVVEWRGDVAVVTLLGEHDMANAGDVETTVEAVLARASTLVIDVSPAQFIDSTILRALLNAAAQAEQLGVGFSLVAEPSSIARRVLELASLVPSLHVADSLDDALPDSRAHVVSTPPGE
jgi:anti-anti-sigma factor